MDYAEILKANLGKGWKYEQIDSTSGGVQAERPSDKLRRFLLRQEIDLLLKHPQRKPFKVRKS